MAKRVDTLLFPLAIAAATASAALGGAPATGGSLAETASISCRIPATPTIAFRVTLPRTPMHIVAADRTLWIALAGRHDPRTGATLAGGSLAAVDPDSGRILRELRLPVDPTQFVVAFGSLWVIGGSNDRRFDGVLRVNPSTVAWSP